MNWFLPWILMNKESFNLVGEPCIWHISLETESSKRGVCKGKQRIAMSLILGYLQKKVMTKLSKNCTKKLVFSTFWGSGQNVFLENPHQQLIFLTRFLLLYKISEKKPNKWILRKVVTKGWMEGWIDPQDHTFRESIIISVIQDLLLC